MTPNDALEAEGFLKPAIVHTQGRPVFRMFALPPGKVTVNSLSTALYVTDGAF
jgi:hypothetical protein